ncbi:MAG TPA: TonB-dependent receptor [Longimicrobiales bacterium]|nr:TonB-dependent receptor [Longimicrobiales bacterium]
MPAGATAQQTGSVVGTVTSNSGTPLVGAQVSIAELNRGTITRSDGTFLLPGLPAGQHVVRTDMLGYRSTTATVSVAGASAARQDFRLADDLLNIEAVVITGTQTPRVQVEAPMAISIITPREIEQANPRSTTEMLRYVPGFTRVESSGGEVNQNITMRGILGVEYVMFMEDGLPVFPTMHTFFMNADNLFRPDENIQRMEVVRGGGSALYGSNTPGAIINFINKTGGPDLRGTMKGTTGTDGLARYDANVSGPLGDDWRFNVGGFYRFDRGVRDPGFPGIRGGQFKGSITRLLENGYVRGSVKMIDDRNQFILPLPFTDRDDPDYVEGFSDYGAFTTPEGNHISIPTPEGRLTLPLEDGLRTDAYWLTADAAFEFGDGWLLQNTAQLMQNEQAWNAIVPFNVDNMANFLATQPANAELRYTNVRDAAGGSITLGPDTCAQSDCLIAPSGQWHVEKPLAAFQNQLTIRRALGAHTLSAGVYFANYSQTNRWFFTETLMDVRDNPRMVDVVVVNPGTGAETPLTMNGFRRYTSLYVNGTGQTTVLSGTLGGSLQLTDALRADGGVRLERNDFYQSVENSSNVDLDGDPTTAFDNMTWGNNTFRQFRHDMTDWAASLGLNYLLTSDLSIYGQGSRAFKMPALDEFLFASAQAQIEQFDARESLTGELGAKWATARYGLTVNGFYTHLKNIVGQGAVTDPVTGEISWIITFSPENRAYGAEFEVAASPFDALRLIGSGTLIKAELATCGEDPNDPDANFCPTGADVGSSLNGVPSFIGNLAATYDVFSGLSVLTDLHYVGEREAAFATATESERPTMPAYLYANLGAEYRLSDYGVTLTGNVLNAFQSKGIEEMNPRASLTGESGPVFLARPLLPRRFTVALRYDF